MVPNRRAAEWWPEVRPRVLDTARRVLGEPDAEDVAGAVIESALRSSVEFRSVEHLTGWAVTRAKWLALDSIRLRRREAAWLRSFWGPRRPTPERSPSSAELIELIEKLPSAQKTALMLTLSGASDRRIAMVMGEQESTVRSLRRHARERLARELWGD